jgi:hypothetical protein
VPAAPAQAPASIAAQVIGLHGPEEPALASSNVCPEIVEPHKNLISGRSLRTALETPGIKELNRG